MQPRTLKHLHDIAGASEEILVLVSGEPERVVSERILDLAVERLLLVIGEALSRVRDDEPQVLDSITDATAIIGMRNAIVHGYDRIDPTRIADAVREDIPILLSEVQALLGE